MDQALDADDEAELINIINTTDGVLGYHDLKTRQSGVVQFVQFHLELSADQSLKQAHATGEALEQRILERFPRAEILIHHDPI